MKYLRLCANLGADRHFLYRVCNRFDVSIADSLDPLLTGEGESFAEIGECGGEDRWFFGEAQEVLEDKYLAVRGSTCADADGWDFCCGQDALGEFFGDCFGEEKACARCFHGDRIFEN